MKNILSVLFLLVLGAFVMCVFFLPHEENRLLSQKLATQLVMPTGVVWVGLMLVCVWGFRLCVLCCFVLLFVFCDVI